MAESMIERVARALCVARGVDPDTEQLFDFSDDMSKPQPDIACAAWRGYERAARAAIEETGVEKLRAALERLSSHSYVSDETSIINQRNVEYSEAVARIELARAALKEGQPTTRTEPEGGENRDGWRSGDAS